jgi:HEAT repeat protein
VNGTLVRRSALGLTCLLALTGPAPALDPVIDSPMYTSPDLETSHRLSVFPEGAKSLWLKALERPEADLRCQAADAVARARRRGVTGLETTVAPLMAALEQPDQHSTVRLSVATALIALDARDAAPALLRQAQAGPADLREVVEPALAQWDYRPARAVWLARLRDAGTPTRNLVLAMRGLAAVREPEATDRLREIAQSDRVAGPVRLEAGRALGLVRQDGLEKDAAGLFADSSPRGLVNRLVAASLLRHHRGDQATRLLQRMAADPDPSVAALAVARLIELDPALVLPSVKDLLASGDAPLRSLAVDVLFRRPSEPHVGLLADRLDDPDTGVRRKARGCLHELAARKEFHGPVIESATRVLARRQWRGLEQATILLTQLDHKPAAGRLVELLTFDRPEVFVTAAWGLRKLAVPETPPAVASYVEAELPRYRTGNPLPGRKDVPPAFIDYQLSQLNQFLGQQKYATADNLLQKFVPRFTPTLPVESRAAAIWALGLLHEGKTDADLAARIEDRLKDVGTMPPEDTRVRWMSAITLGRMGAKDSLPSLRQFFTAGEPSQDPVNNACGWAIARITGEALPLGRTIRGTQLDWFLTPSER